MQKLNSRLLIALAALTMLYPAWGLAKQINFTDNNSIQLNGDSTVRKFSSLSSKIKIGGTASSEPQSSQFPWTPSQIDVSVDVKTLKSESTTLDEHMYESLKADKFPQINIALSKFRFENKTVFAGGTLTIAGVTKPVELQAVYEPADNKINFKGAYSLQMTDFGIQPPTMMMGTIKTANRIEIIFNVSCSTTLLEENK